MGRDPSHCEGDELSGFLMSDGVELHGAGGGRGCWEQERERQNNKQRHL